jgi:hypothetical protein
MVKFQVLDHAGDGVSAPRGPGRGTGGGAGRERKGEDGSDGPAGGPHGISIPPAGRRRERSCPEGSRHAPEREGRTRPSNGGAGFEPAPSPGDRARTIGRAGEPP